MNKKLFRSARMGLTVIFLMAAMGSELYAGDSNGRYLAYGFGQRTCEDYIKFREKNFETLQPNERYTKDEIYDVVNKIVEQWIAGFLTAHNFYVADTYDLAGSVTMDDLKARLEKSCRANNKQYIAEAVIAIAQELNPNRVKVDPAKREQMSNQGQ